MSQDQWRKGTPEEQRLAEGVKAAPPEKAIMDRSPNEWRINAAFDKLSDDLKSHGLELHFDLEGFPRAKPSWETEIDDLRPKLKKRPVAFRVRNTTNNAWVLFEHEVAANGYSELWKTEVQGLYVRDGT